MNHSVEANLNNDPRISVSFNFLNILTLRDEKDMKSLFGKNK